MKRTEPFEFQNSTNKKPSIEKQQSYAFIDKELSNKRKAILSQLPTDLVLSVLRNAVTIDYTLTKTALEHCEAANIAYDTNELFCIAIQSSMNKDRDYIKALLKNKGISQSESWVKTIESPNILDLINPNEAAKAYQGTYKT